MSAEAFGPNAVREDFIRKVLKADYGVSLDEQDRVVAWFDEIVDEHVEMVALLERFLSYHTAEDAVPEARALLARIRGEVTA